MILLRGVSLLALFLGACSAVAPPEEPGKSAGPVQDSADARPTAAAPFFDARSHEVGYAGPGREDPPPENVTEVRIGWFGPADPAAPLGGAMWCAATLAVEEANREGGLKGIPFRLLERWSENPWGSGIKGVAELVYKENVWALIGAPDSASAHLVEQIVAKARVPFLSPVATDKTTNLVNVPWIFAGAPGDPEIARVLADTLGASSEGAEFALVSGTDHDSRQLTTTLLSTLGKVGTFPGIHLEVRPGEKELPQILSRVVADDPATVVAIAGGRESARIVDALRAAGVPAPIILGPQAGRRTFGDSLSTASEGLSLPLLWRPQDGGRSGKEFAATFRERFGFSPDYAAAYTYDATRLLVRAVRDVGLNRARIRDRIRTLPPWDGVTGTLSWDPTGRRSGGIVTMEAASELNLPNGGRRSRGTASSSGSSSGHGVTGATPSVRNP